MLYLETEGSTIYVVECLEIKYLCVMQRYAAFVLKIY